MATIALTVLATALTASMTNALLAAAIVTAASWAGSYLDSLLFNPTIKSHSEGPKLNSAPAMSAVEGTPINRHWGRARLSTTIIWVTDFREVQVNTTQTSGGKSVAPKQSVTQTSYQYYASFAVGLCEGAIAGIGRVWADGEVLDLTKFTTRLYLGTETQTADAKIQAVEGANYTPAFRGVAYLVFEEALLEQFGNRIPQITVEVFKPAVGASNTGIEAQLKAVDMGPGYGEYVYATENVWVDNGGGNTTSKSIHSDTTTADFSLSMDALDVIAPNVAALTFPVVWFGDDLRVGTCTVKPRVENNGAATKPWDYLVGNLGRSSYAILELDSNGLPLTGGTPADRGVLEGLVEAIALGSVTFAPTILMDIRSSNALNNPYSNNAASTPQPTYPDRGLITCSPAAGYTGTVDKTGTAATQVNTFFGSAAASDFTYNSTTKTVSYSGPAEWSYRRFILHYAKLIAGAGYAIDAFLIGTGLKGIMQIRSAAGTYPAVAKMQTLAADVSAILGGSVKVGYAADWSEYSNHRPSDGTNDVYFNLDPLWADANIDFVGVNYGPPLSDWRSTSNHLDASVAPNIYDQTYLQGRVQGGEHYDWTYTSQANRDSQTRTNITDPGGYSKPWVYKYKDLKNWWLNAHYDRPAGTQSGSPTGWTAQGKPFWLFQVGCNAIDKGANQPDTHSPYYSNLTRDDFMMRSVIEAELTVWAHGGSNNPVSGVYSADMVNMNRFFVRTWDPRPFPFFPQRAVNWHDAGDWTVYSYLSGRLGSANLRLIVEEICGNVSNVTIDASQLYGEVIGYTLDSIMSPRDAISPLMAIYAFDACESNGTVKFVMRGNASVATYAESDMVVSSTNAEGPFQETRAQETDLPKRLVINYVHSEGAYDQGTATTNRLRGYSDREVSMSLPLVADATWMQSVSDALIIEAWIGRETAAMTLPPSALALDPTDVVTVNFAGRTETFRVDNISLEMTRNTKLIRTDASVYGRAAGPPLFGPVQSLSVAGAPYVFLMELPIMTGTEEPIPPYLVGAANPWPGGLAVYRSANDTDFALDTVIPSAAATGSTGGAFASGVAGRWDTVNTLTVVMDDETVLEDATEAQVLNGANLLAVQTSLGWEIIQWRDSTLTATKTYQLQNLLRGQFGTDADMDASVAGGAKVVILNSPLQKSTMPNDLRGLDLFWKFTPVSADLSDPRTVEVEYTDTGIGIRPYTPCHLKGIWDATNNDVTLTWKRRTRIKGDTWDNGDVPLNEETESYRIRIYNGSTVIRSAVVTGVGFNFYNYTATLQGDDFASLQSTVKFDVAQWSGTYGWGPARLATITRGLSTEGTPADIAELIRQGHGTDTPGDPVVADGNFIDLLFQRSATQPATPTDNNPAGWFEAVPAGTTALWAVRAPKTAAGVLIGTWSTPELITGLNPRGQYVSTSTYNNYDWVLYNSGSYVCTSDGTTGQAPSGDANANAYWDVLAAPGPPGTPATPPSAFSATIDLTTSTTGVNLRTIANANGYTGLSDATVTFRVPSGVTIQGAAGAPDGGIAVDFGSWPSGYVITLTLLVQNGGKVYGSGGKGPTTGNGGKGGDAVYCRLNASVTVNAGGEIKSGGGGGGAGQRWKLFEFDEERGIYIHAGFLAGGQGGGGFSNGPGANAGTTSGGGAGGSGATDGGHTAGNGGAGGNAATDGTNGSAATGVEDSEHELDNAAGVGGVQGYAIRKNGYTITIVNSGTITGTQA